MSLESNVAIVALVVSLIALFVALSQLSVEFLGTAEASRRCSSTILGPWSRLRRRIFSPSELRFKVQFATPYVAVIPDDERYFEEIEKYTGEPVSLADAARFECDGAKASVLGRWWHWVCETFGWMFGFDSAPSQAEVRDVLRSSVVGETNTGLFRKVSTIHLVPFQMRRLKEKTKDLEWQILRSRDVRASWFSLLRALHDTYDQLDKAAAGNTAALKSQKPPDGVEFNNFSAVPSTPDDSQLFSHPVVAVQYWRWEFMPPDLLKPMAISTLNNVLLIGLRLGMNWRVLDLRTSLFVAEGNGYSLSSFEIRGLGLGFHRVLQDEDAGVDRIDMLEWRSRGRVRIYGHQERHH